MMPLSRRAVLGALVIVIAGWEHTAFAQRSLTSPGDFGGYNFSGIGSYYSDSPTYLPFSTSMGGFIPYSPGPRGGLGVQPGMRNFAPPAGSGGMGSMTGFGSGLGSARSAIAPPAPLGASLMGSGGGVGMSSTGGLIRRTPAGGSMRSMSRPPVGNYPFRQPPSLLGPGTTAPSMSM